MRKYSFVLILLLALGLIGILSISCSDINTVGDANFTPDGKLIVDDSASIDSFKLIPPARIKYYIESSGSMNGFFRPNRPTHFKSDVWEIMNYYSAAIPTDITVLTNDGSTGAQIPLNNFQTLMNTGAFVSNASTKVPLMLESIYKDFNPKAGEVAILISDMKYSPVGSKAPDVLLKQYPTDISKIIGPYHYPVCLISATSNYLDKSGTDVEAESPYYYFMIGPAECLAYLRNGISTLLDNNKHFVDNIESGFDYGAMSYSFGIPDNCFQLDDENPTFVDFDTSVSDTCLIKLKVDLENYRWLVADSNVFPECFKIKALYGSNVKVDKIEYQIENITDKILNRKATAIIDLKVFDLASDSEVLEWGLEFQDSDCRNLMRFMGATSENDLSKTFSLDGFLKGIFYGGVVNRSLKHNYILISKNS